MLYKQLGVTVNSIMPARTLQDGGTVGFDTMLIGFLTRSLCTPKLSCSTDQTCKCLGSQLWVFLSSQEGYHGEPAITQEQKHFSKIHESDCKPSTCLSCLYLVWLDATHEATCMFAFSSYHSESSVGCRNIESMSICCFKVFRTEEIQYA